METESFVIDTSPEAEQKRSDFQVPQYRVGRKVVFVFSIRI